MGAEEQWMRLQADAALYADQASSFARTHGISELLKDLDHFAIKARNTESYEQLINAFYPLADEASYTRMDGRRIATLTLSRFVSFSDLGVTRVLEIMEPRPEASGTLIAGIEHVEFLQPYSGKVIAALRKAGVPYEERKNTGHDFIVVPIGDGHEIKLTSRRLHTIVQEELANGTAFKIRRN